jgi:predicted transposase/invertase (TIGR01784 family)
MEINFSENPMIAEAYRQFQHCIQDEGLRNQALARQRFLNDIASRMNSAEQYGLEKGMEIARLEDARKLKSLGVANDIIVKATGLSCEAVEKL